MKWRTGLASLAVICAVGAFFAVVLWQHRSADIAYLPIRYAIQLKASRIRSELEEYLSSSGWAPGSYDVEFLSDEVSCLILDAHPKGYVAETPGFSGNTRRIAISKVNYQVLAEYVGENEWRRMGQPSDDPCLGQIKD